MAERTDDFADRKCMTPKFQLRYCTLVEPRAFADKGDDAKKRYSIQVRIPKNIDLDKGVKLPNGTRSNSLRSAVEAAIAEQWPKKRPKIKGDHQPIKDGDEKEDEDYEGQWYFNANSKNRPQILDMRARDITNDPEKIEETFYDGCYCRAYIMACGYENEGACGVKWHLIAIQKVENGDRIEHRIDSSNMFEAVEEEDDEDDDRATKKLKKLARDEDEDEKSRKKKSKSQDDDDEEDERPKKSKKRSRDDDDDEFS